MPKNAKPAAAVSKRTPAAKPAAAAKRASPAAKPARRHPEPEVAQTTQPAEDPRRLLREAAWAMMFGRSGANNPFGR